MTNIEMYRSPTLEKATIKAYSEEDIRKFPLDIQPLIIGTALFNMDHGYNRHSRVDLNSL